MSNAILFNYYNLKKGVFAPDFLVSVEHFMYEYVSNQKGFISFSLLVDGDTWADIIISETMESAKNFANPGNTHDLIEKYYSFLNFDSFTSHLFSVERNYQFKSVMPNVVTFVSYKLKKGTTVSEFLLAADKAGNRPLSEDSVIISWKLLADGDLWADLICWESMEGPKEAASSENKIPAIKEYLSYIGEVPYHCHFTVKKILNSLIDK
jgi:hypothetical protein